MSLSLPERTLASLTTWISCHVTHSFTDMRLLWRICCPHPVCSGWLVPCQQAAAQTAASASSNLGQWEESGYDISLKLTLSHQLWEKGKKNALKSDWNHSGAAVRATNISCGDIGSNICKQEQKSACHKLELSNTTRFSEVETSGRRWFQPGCLYFDYTIWNISIIHPHHTKSIIFMTTPWLVSCCADGFATTAIFELQSFPAN